MHEQNAPNTGKKKLSIRFFDDREVRAVWSDTRWWFSVLDIVGVLNDQDSYEKNRNYWKYLKAKLTNEGIQLGSGTNQLKLEAADGKMYKNDAADTEMILQLIQSVPSKKAEPCNMRLAQVGRDRIDVTIDPEQSIDRAIQNYHRLGYSGNWINQRIKLIEVRKALTDEWDKSSVTQREEYASLTDLMTRTWRGMTTRAYKQHRG